MKNFLLSTFLFICFISCNKDALIESPVSLEERGKPTKVQICHLDDQGVYKTISIPASALATHLAKGSYQLDVDGDGHTAIGACSGSMDDCDDNNADVWENCNASCSVVTNDFLSSLHLWQYWDAEEGCRAFSDVNLGVWMINNYNVEAYQSLYVLFHADYHYIVYIDANQNQTWWVVEEGTITLDEWNCSLEAAQAFIRDQGIMSACGSGIQTAKNKLSPDGQLSILKDKLAQRISKTVKSDK